MSPRIFLCGEMSVRREMGRAKGMRGGRVEQPKLVLMPPVPMEIAETPAKKPPQSAGVPANKAEAAR